MRGPLAPYGPGFHGELVDQGYAGSSAGRQVGLMSQVSEWMLETGLRPCELTPEAVDRFLALRRAQGRKRGISPAATAPLMCYLRRLSAAPEPAPSAPASAGLDRVLGEYRTYLVKERGLAPGTIRGYLRVARWFLSEQSAAGEDWTLREPTAAEVSAFVVRAVRERRTGSAKFVVAGMRALLRFLHVDGKISKPLAQVVPGVASWRLSSLPKALDPSQVDRLLASCDQATPIGRRDRAKVLSQTLWRLREGGGLGPGRDRGRGELGSERDPGGGDGGSGCGSVAGGRAGTA